LMGFDYFMSRAEVVRFLPKTMSDELLEIILGWDKVKKSPFNNKSWYNAEKDWNGYIDGALRVSDHWNFGSSGDDKKHCETIQEIENNKYWSLESRFR